MRVLILADHFESNRGGAVEIARIQAAYLAKTNKVDILTAKASMEFGQANFRIFDFPIVYNLKLRNYLGLYHPKAIKILKNHLQSHKYDICYTHNIHTNWSYAALEILKRAGVRTILTLHDVTAITPYVKLCNIPYKKRGEIYEFDYYYSWLKHFRDSKILFNPIRNYLIRKYISQVSETIAVSNALADFLRTNGIRVDRVVHNKLPQEEYGPSSTYNNSIFFGGRLSISKGALQAVRYLANLRQKYKLNSELLVAGHQGVVTEKMRTLAKKLQIEGSLKFLGWLSKTEYEPAMRDCGVVIVPSICFDSLPTIILEAMRAARPVVATIYGGSREMVEDGKTGYVCDPKQTEEFAEAMARILSDKNLAKNMGLAGFEKFRKEFSL